MGRALTSASKIREKLASGEIQASSRRLFQNVNYHVRAELIQPYLHYIDEKVVQRSLDFFVDHSLRHTVQNLAIQMTKIQGKQIGAGDLMQSMQQVYRKLPREIFMDMFNQYYNPMESLKYEDTSEHNRQRYRMLDKTNDPISKILTQHSHVKSMVFTQKSSEYLLAMLAVASMEEPEQFEKMMQQLRKPAPPKPKQQPPSQQQNQTDTQSTGEGDEESDEQGEGQGSQSSSGNSGNQPNKKSQQSSNQPSDQQGGESQAEPNNSGAENPFDGDEGAGNSGASGSGGAWKGKSEKQKPSAETSLERIMNKFLDDKDKNAKQLFEDMMKEAQQQASNIDDTYSEEDQNDKWSDISQGGQQARKALSQFDPQTLKAIFNELKTIKMNMNSLKEKLKTLLDKSMSYFSAREIPIYESFIDSGDVAGIMEMELFHPKMRIPFMGDIMTKDSIKLGKINVYVDVSGSMSSSAGVTGAKGVSRMTFAKAMMLKLKEMDMLNDVYTFDTSVHKEGNEMADILTIDYGGGTDIDTVIRHIRANNHNSLIITDAEDNIREYSEYAYLIGVAGASFRRCQQPALGKYYKGQQMVVFNGDTIQHVDENGNVKPKQR